MDQEDIKEVHDELKTMRQQLKNLLEQKESASAPVTVVVQRERRLRNRLVIDVVTSDCTQLTCTII